MALFTPPDVSASVCENVPFEIASDTAIDNKAEFDAFDQTPEGMNDPSRCKALLAFPDGTIFWSSKMAIDGDGPAAGPGRLCGSELDPDSARMTRAFTFAIQIRLCRARRFLSSFCPVDIQNQYRTGPWRRGAGYLQRQNRCSDLWRYWPVEEDRRRLHSFA